MSFLLNNIQYTQKAGRQRKDRTNCKISIKYVHRHGLDSQLEIIKCGYMRFVNAHEFI